MKKGKIPRAIDLFAGAGGLTAGLWLGGYKVIGAVELDATACKAYRLNHAEVRLWEQDICSLSGPAILRELAVSRGELELLAACPPCQGFSTLRTCNGLRRNRDPSNSLVLEVLRLVRSIRPMSVMVENVPGLAKTRKFEVFVKGLRKSGYAVEWRILDVADYGVPQRRQRLVLLASRQGVPTFAKGTRRLRTVWDAIGALPRPGASRDELHRDESAHGPRVRDVIGNIPRNGGSRASLPPAMQLRCHRKTSGFRDVYGRMAWNLPSPTITTGCINPSKGRFLHPTANRAITLREAALLQSFPKNYRFPLDRGRYAVATMIGNALPPEFIRRHAVALREGLRTGPVR